MTNEFQHNIKSGYGEQIKWVNTSSEVVPAYGIVQPSSYDSVENRWNIVKPTEVGDIWWVNSGTEVISGDLGVSYPWHIAQPTLITGDNLNVGANCGPVPGEWYMAHGTKFSIVGTHDVDDTGMVMVSGQSRRRRAVMTSPLAENVYPLGFDYVLTPPQTASADLLFTTASGVLDYERNPGGSIRSVTVSNFLKGISVANGVYVRIEELDGFWEPYVADCPPDGSA
jgi:hypothetical protein